MPDDYDPSDDYEEYETSYSLEDVCNRLDEITKILRDRRSALSELVSAVAILWVFFALIPWMWHSKLVYSWRYGVAVSQVNIEKEPTDCDFLHAPLGDKDCRYERQVSTVLVRTDSSDMATKGLVHYISYDDGKTWTLDSSVPPINPGIAISWEKVENR
jgi:hypothetical protein